MTQISANSTLHEILKETGSRLRATRLQANLSHQELAAASGVGVATVVRAEAGRNTSLATLVKLLRVLGRLDALDQFLAPPIESPLQLFAQKGRIRQRVRKPKPADPDAGG